MYLRDLTESLQVTRDPEIVQESVLFLSITYRQNNPWHGFHSHFMHSLSFLLDWVALIAGD